MFYATFKTYEGFISHYLPILQQFIDECFHKKCPCGVIATETHNFQNVNVALFSTLRSKFLCVILVHPSQQHTTRHNTSNAKESKNRKGTNSTNTRTMLRGTTEPRSTREVGAMNRRTRPLPEIKHKTGVRELPLEKKNGTVTYIIPKVQTG